MRSLLAHLNLPVDEERLNCIARSHRETFHRVVNHQQEVRLFKFQVFDFKSYFKVKPFEERPELGRKVEEVVREAKQLLDVAGWHLPSHLYPEFPSK